MSMPADGLDVLWRSQDGVDNATILRASRSDVFRAIAELDAAGHRMLNRMSSNTISNIDHLVGTALLRRAITHFVGVRHLFEASAVEPAKLPVRALFETALATRYLVHGGRSNVDLFTGSDERKRETRARYFYVGAERRGLYSRQGMLDGRWGRTSMSRRERRKLREEIITEVDRLRKEFSVQWRAHGPLRCYAKKKYYHDPKPWYSFGFRSGKVGTIRALATRFRWQTEYELFYSALSGVTHPTGVGHDVTITDLGAEVHHPYIADAFDLLAFFSINLQLFVLAWNTKAYLPGTLPDMQAVQRKVAAWTADLDPGVPTGWL